MKTELEKYHLTNPFHDVDFKKLDEYTNCELDSMRTRLQVKLAMVSTSKDGVFRLIKKNALRFRIKKIEEEIGERILLDKWDINE